MKQTPTLRFATLLFAVAMLLSGCSSQLSVSEEAGKTVTEETVTLTEKETEEEKELPPISEANATDEDIASLENLYAGTKAYYGDIHSHPGGGIIEDGRQHLSVWKEMTDELDVDFYAAMNHKQVAHMLDEGWDDTVFIGGTEPAASITDSKAQDPRVHYNMIFPDYTDLLEILSEFPEYKYTGGKNGIELSMGTFGYPNFTTARFQELIEAIKSKGGLFVNVHPKQQMKSSNPEDYYFADYTGLEVFYSYEGTIAGQDTKDNYKLWTDLLASGKRLWATAGSDSHGYPVNTGLTTLYSTVQKDDNYVEKLSTGNFVCGFVGIRMTLGDTCMGSSTDFDGKRLVVSVGDFHSSMFKEGRTYTVNIITNEGVVFIGETDGTETVYFAIDADENADFYRVEVLDEKRASQPIIAIGNPIWND